MCPEDVPYCRRFPEQRQSELVSDVRKGKVDFTRFKHFSRVRVQVVEQDEGDVIFV